MSKKLYIVTTIITILLVSISALFLLNKNSIAAFSFIFLPLFLSFTTYKKRSEYSLWFYGLYFIILCLHIFLLLRGMLDANFDYALFDENIRVLYLEQNGIFLTLLYGFLYLYQNIEVKNTRNIKTLVLLLFLLTHAFMFGVDSYFIGLLVELIILALSIVMIAKEKKIGLLMTLELILNEFTIICLIGFLI